MPEEVQLTPEQQAQYDQMAASAPAEPALPVEINPIRDFDANQLAELAVKDKEGFDLVGEFRRNQDLWADPAIVQKAADALNLVKQRGFELSDLPGPKKIGQTVLESAKGFGKQLWNYGSALVGMAQGAIAEPFSTELATGFAEGVTEKLSRNIAGTEEAMAGLSQLPGKAVQKIGRATGLTKDFNQFTPDEKISDLWKDVGVSEVQQTRVTGQGPFTQAVTGGAAGELPAEDVSTLAAGDPFSFVTFSKGFQLAGRAIPGVVRGAIAKTGEKAGEAAAIVGGRITQAGGNLTELGSKAVQAIAPTTGAVAGGVKGGVLGGPLGVIPGVGIGASGGRVIAKAAKKVSTAGARVAEAGKQLAGVAPVTSSLAQAGRDILQAAPGAAGTTAIGLGQDIGLSAITSETPVETQGAIGIGTALGAAGAIGRVGRRVISGQLVAPREYGVNTITPSSGNFPTLDAIHSESIRGATPGERTRLNAVRLFAKGAAPGTDIIFARDPAALTKTLTELGIAPDTAAQYAQQEGFFTVGLPDKSGTPRNVIIARNVESAPHEAFHAVQDVLGESANRELDNIVRQEYADQWENEGNRYATRLVGDLAGRDWRETILDESGWGHAEAMEKLSNAVSNEVISQTGAEPPAGFVADRVRADWRRIFEAARSRNPAARPEHVWREILSPEEATAVADRYIARELAAENFDIVFKNLGAALGEKRPLVRKLADVAAELISILGGEPLAGRRSEIGQIEPRFGVTEAVTRAARGQRPAPVVEPKLPRQPVSVPRTQEEASDAAAVAKEIAASAPEPTTREMLGAVAEAIAQRAGVKINYLSAPGEPAAATTSNRSARREIIEAFRTMPAEARVLWEKNFFPERVIRTKGEKYQILGWAPEVFAANAHKLAGWLADHTSVTSPYAVDAATKTFTPDAWQQLFADTQKFVRNQQAGATGAGETLVVPESIRERGFTAPARTGGESPLAQDRADVINMLFGFKLPETPRIQRGRLPLAIAGEEISAATQPGRVEVPVRPRGEFTGIEAAAQDIAGRPIQEVNPFRNAVEAAGNPPSLIEAVQRLNLENIKEVAIAPEQPEFRGNTLTLTAGFQPSKEPRSIRAAAIKDEDSGQIFTGRLHFEADAKADEAGSSGPRTDGYITNEGEFLNREQAELRAREFNQISTKFPPTGELEGEIRQFQPRTFPEQVQRLVDMSPDEWRSEVANYKGKLGSGLTGWAWDTGAMAKSPEDVLALRQVAGQFQEAARLAMRETRESAEPAKALNVAMELTGRAQAAREAFEAATGENLEGTNKGSAVPAIQKYIDPSYKPPVPTAGDVTPGKTGEDVAPTEGQFQPRSYEDLVDQVRHGLSDRFATLQVARQLDKGLTAQEFNDMNYSDQKIARRFVEHIKEKKPRGFKPIGKYFNPKYEGIPSGSGEAKEIVPAAYRKAGIYTDEFFKELKETPSDYFGSEDFARKVIESLTIEVFQEAGGTEAVKTVLGRVASGEDLSTIYSGEKGVSYKEWPIVQEAVRNWMLDKHPEAFSSPEEAMKKIRQQLAGRWGPEVAEEAIKLGEGKAGKQFQPKRALPNSAGDEEFNVVHYSSNESLKQVSPKFFGKGKATPTDLRGGPKSYFFVEGSELGQDAALFENAGLSAYETTIPGSRLYDLREGKPDELGWRSTINREEADDNVRAAGYDGIVLDTEDGRQVVAMFKPVKVAPKTQFQPGQETLFDLPEPTDFPEAVRARKEVPSNLVGSPRAKQFSKREDAISDFADRLVEEAKRQEGNPAFQIGKQWYSDFTPQLKREFGSDAPLMAELLAATSPQTNVETNFGYAIDVLNNWKAGKYSKLIDKLNEGYRRLEDGSLAKIYRRDVRDGKVESPPENPSDATYIAWWILKHDLLPRGTSGAPVGLHSKNVAKVLTRRWLSETKGPKTKNFVQNLIGTGDEATIDIWADRLLRRIGYEGFVDRWRIKPENVKGVSDADFEFGQQVFRAAADRLGMKPSDLQAALWFTEKQRWADNKWSDKLDLGDFRTEIKRTEEYRQGFERGLGPAEVRDEAKQVVPEFEQLGLEISPRRVRVR